MDYQKIRREYIHEALDPESLDKNPMVEFQKWFNEAYTYFGDDTNAMSLATADKNGRPSVRTVLLKGVTEQGFLFYTNYESHKGIDLEENPQAALLFYWPGLDRQIRIEGTVSRVPREVSEAYFKSRPRGSQISAAASPQSRKITLEELTKLRSAMEALNDIPLPKVWGGYEVQGEYFEFWNGRENRYHDRIVYKRTSPYVFDQYRIAP